MPLTGETRIEVADRQYFTSLVELDAWAATSTQKKLEGILKYTPRPRSTNPGNRGKLLVCHDYKGGYTEDPFSLSYTFNSWSSCDTFVYFSHHCVTVPPPGWINAAHRQGVKILGTLIFESGAEEDCLRLLVGNLPGSPTGPARTQPSVSSVPLSPHYARLLADLAWQRGFDGYLLNFECSLGGGLEQTRALAPWITLLQSEISNKIGSHGETIWYDSVVVTGQLAWQDRLNSFNLPFFLSSTGIFTNYTWLPDNPLLTAQYFLTLDPSLTEGGVDPRSANSAKSLNDIYMGVDVFGRGSHGGGGFGSYKAISHIAPESLGLSVALFGNAWTWETEQDKPGWSWEKWWEYDSTLWVGPVSGSVDVPEAPRREGEPECIHGPFLPISSFFPRNHPPDPLILPFHTTFSPGVGRAWFVDGTKVHQYESGWTDVDKQCAMGNMVWPRPRLVWEGGERDELPDTLSTVCMDDAWNGGSSLRLNISDPGSGPESGVFRSFWLPVQSLAIRLDKLYDATVILKVDSVTDWVDLDIGLSAKLNRRNTRPIHVTPIDVADSGLPGGWMKVSIQFTVSRNKGEAADATTVAMGLVMSTITEDPSQPTQASLLLGQLNVYPSAAAHYASSKPQVLWADFKPINSTARLSGVLTWEVAASFPPQFALDITSPEDPVPVWKPQPPDPWFPTFLYFNIYALRYKFNGTVGQPDDAVWVGTSGLDGRRNHFTVVQENLPFLKGRETAETRNIRFYIQGVTDRGEVLPWEQCVYADAFA